MGSKANEITEALFDSMSLLMDKKISTIKFDQTIDATIVDDSEADIGKYMVSNGSSTFAAFSTEEKYSNKQAVLVLIPQGNYDNQKMIVGKKVDDENGPILYKSPFQEIVDVTNNLITGEHNWQYWANENNPKLGCPWDVDVPDFKNSISYSAQGENGLIWDSGEIYEAGFTRIGLQAQFSTWLGEYDTILGNYGIAIELTFKCLELETHNTFSKIITFDSDEFFGDVYNFETYYIQENVYDISEYTDYPIVNIKLYAYQRNNFQSTEGLIYDIMDSENDFSTVSPNIFIKDPYICLGIPAEDFTADMATLLTTDSYTYYKGSAASTGSEVAARTGSNLKHIILRWIHKDAIKNVIKTVLPNEVPKGYEIRWYRHLLGAPSPDQFAGAHWFRYGGIRTEPDETGEWVIPAFSEIFELNSDFEPYYVYSYDTRRYTETTLQAQGISSAATYNSEHQGFRKGNTSTYIRLYTNTDIMSNEVEIVFQPNVNFQTEQIKAIVVKNEGTDENPIYRMVAASNVLTFTNNDDVRSRATVIDENALAIAFEDDERGNYFLYNRAGQVGSKEDEEVRGMKAVFDPDEPDVYLKADLEQPWTSIQWEFPAESDGTMITPATENSSDGVPVTPENASEVPNFSYTGVNHNIPTFTNVTSVGFFIKSSLNRNATHNTIRLTVVKDGQEYHAEASMLFGTAGTSGSDYTIVLVWENGENSFNLSEKKPLSYTAEGASARTDTDSTKSALAGRVYLLDQTGTLAELQADSTYEFEWYKTYIDTNSITNGDTISEGVVYEDEKVKYPILNSSKLKTLQGLESTTINGNSYTPTYLISEKYGSTAVPPYYTYNPRSSEFEEVNDVSLALQNGQIVYRCLEESESKLIKLDFRELDEVYKYDFVAQDSAVAKARKIANEIANDDATYADSRSTEYQYAVNAISDLVTEFKNQCQNDIETLGYTVNNFLTTDSGYQVVSKNAYDRYLAGRIVDVGSGAGKKRKYYWSSSNRAFIKHNNTYIIDPWEDYYEVETYYEPIVSANRKYNRTQINIYKDYTQGKEGRFVLTGNPTINSLYILQVTLTKFGDFDLVARFPVPLKQGDVRLSNVDGRIIRPAFVEGPTEVRYSTTGETDFDKNFYKISISANPNYVAPLNTSAIGKFRLIYDPRAIDEDITGFQNFLPSLANGKDENGKSNASYKLEDLFINPMLYPPGIYFEDTPLYGVQYILEEPIIDKTNQDNNTNTLLAAGTVLWTQPVYSYQDNYPSTTLNKWNGKEITTDNDTGIMVANGLAAGKKESDNTFTGVVLGDWSKDDIDAFITSTTGVYGFNHGAMSYSLKDDGTAFFGKDGRGRIYLSGNKAQIYSAQWLSSQEGMLLDIDDGYMKLDRIGDANVKTDYNAVGDLESDLIQNKTVYYNRNYAPLENWARDTETGHVQYYPYKYTSIYKGNSSNDKSYSYSDFSGRNNLANNDYIWYYGIEQIHKNDTGGDVVQLIPGPNQRVSDIASGTYYFKTIDKRLVPGKTYYTYANSDYTAVGSPNVSNIGTYYEHLNSHDNSSSIVNEITDVYLTIGSATGGKYPIAIALTGSSNKRSCLIQTIEETIYSVGKYAADNGIIDIWQKNYKNRKIYYFLLKSNDSIFTSARINAGIIPPADGDYSGAGKIFRAVGYQAINSTNIQNYNNLLNASEGFFFSQVSGSSNVKQNLKLVSGSIKYTANNSIIHHFDPEIEYYKTDAEVAGRYITLSVAEKTWPLGIGRDRSVGSRKFKVNWDGQMFAEDGIFSGKITSREGEIGGWIIDKDMLYSKWHGSDHDEWDGGNGVVLSAADGAIYGAGIFTKRGKIGGWHIERERLYGGNTQLHRTAGIMTDVVKIKATEEVDYYTDASNWQYFGGMGYIGAEFNSGELTAPGVALFYGDSAKESSSIFKANNYNLGFKWYDAYMSINKSDGTPGVVGVNKRWQFGGGGVTNLDAMGMTSYKFEVGADNDSYQYKLNISGNGDLAGLLGYHDNVHSSWIAWIKYQSIKFFADGENQSLFITDSQIQGKSIKTNASNISFVANGGFSANAGSNGNLNLSAGLNYSLNVTQNATERITLARSLTVGGNNTETITGANTVAITGTNTVTIAGAHSVTSTAGLTLSGGAYQNNHSSVKLTCGAENQEGIYARFG